MNNRIAFALPVYNGARFVRNALLSLLDQAEVTDVYIYDNGPDEQNYLAIQDLIRERVFYHRNENNIGYVGNINKCLNLALKGYDYIGILHHDDFHLPGSIQGFFDAIKQHPNAGLITCSVAQANTTGELTQPAFCELNYLSSGPEAVRYCWSIFCSAAIYRSDAIKEVGMLSDNYPYSADVEHFARIGSKFDIVKVPGVFIASRLHEDNYRYETWAKSDFPLSFLSMLERIEELKGVPRCAVRQIALTENASLFGSVCTYLLLKGKISAAARLGSLFHFKDFNLKLLKGFVRGIRAELKILWRTRT